MRNTLWYVYAEPGKEIKEKNHFYTKSVSDWSFISAEVAEISTICMNVSSGDIASKAS